MFSSWKQAVCNVKDGAARQWKLVLFYVAWSLVCICWNVWSCHRMYGFYGVKISLADFVIFGQHWDSFGLLILPVAMLVVMKCKGHSLNMHFILRYGGRAGMLRRQIMESAVYAASLSLYLVIFNTAAAFIFNRHLINWMSQDSLYYTQTGMQSSANFLSVAAAVTLMYFVKLMLIILILDILLWQSKYLFLLWVVIIVLVGLEVIRVKSFFSLFSIDYAYWGIPWKQGILVVLGGLLMALEYLAGTLLIKKRDIFQ